MIHGDSVRRTSGSVKTSATSIAFEVFCFLMGNQEFQILKITFT